MLRTNLHTHTTRCRHAAGTESDYVEAACRRGLTELGFSDHAPYLFPKPAEYYSGFRMFPEDAEDYVQTISSLRDAVRGQISLLIGYEIEYYPAYFEKTEAFLRRLGYDYLILGQHFTYNETDGIYAGQGSGDPAQLAAYTDQVIEAMRTGLFRYVAHPDVFRFDGDPAFYRKQAERLCRAAAEQGIPLEINLLGIRSGRHYPNPAFWEIAGREGVTAVLGIDAHSPKAILDTEAEKTAAALAARFGVRIREENFLPEA